MTPSESSTGRPTGKKKAQTTEGAPVGRSGATIIVALIAVLAAIGLIAYFGFISTGREGDTARPPEAVGAGAPTPPKETAETAPPSGEGKQ